MSCRVLRTTTPLDELFGTHSQLGFVPVPLPVHPPLPSLTEARPSVELFRSPFGLARILFCGGRSWRHGLGCMRGFFSPKMLFVMTLMILICFYFILFYSRGSFFFLRSWWLIIIYACTCIHTIVGRTRHVFGLIALSKKWKAVIGGTTTSLGLAFGIIFSLSLSLDWIHGSQKAVYLPSTAMPSYILPTLSTVVCMF